VLSLSDESVRYAEGVVSKIAAAGVRVEGDLESATVGSKIRNAQLQKIPYMLVIGPKEEQSGTLAVRARDGEVRYGVGTDEFLAEIKRKSDALE
jgi:threonyl-tRNA synthetase